VGLKSQAVNLRESHLFEKFRVNAGPAFAFRTTPESRPHKSIIAQIDFGLYSIATLFASI
jgi:hypothetical protein